MSSHLRMARRSSISTARCSPAPRARCSRRRCAPPGVVSRSIPGENAAVPGVQHRRRDPAVDGARPPGGDVRQGSVAGGVPRRGRGCRRRLGRARPAARRPAVRRASRRGPARSCSPPPRPTTWSSRSPTCSASTTSSPRGTASTPTASTTGRIVGNFVWSTGKLAAVREWATAPRLRPRAQLRLQRQRVRHAAARRGRPSVRRQPRPADAADGARRAGGRCSTSPARRRPTRLRVRRIGEIQSDTAGTPSASRTEEGSGMAKLPVINLDLQELRPAAHPPVLLPVRALRHRRARRTSRRPVRRSSSPTTAATSTPRRWP